MFAPKGLKSQLAILIGGDFFLSTAAACGMSFGLATPSFAWPYGCVFAAPAIGFIYVGSFYFQDLYMLEGQPRSSYRIAASALAATVLATLVLLLAAASLPALNLGVPFYVGDAVISALLLMAWRVFAHRYLLTRLDIGVMALGIGEAGPLMAEEIALRSHLGYRFLGFATLKETGESSYQYPSRHNIGPLHNASSVAEITNRHPVDIMVLLDPSVPVRELVRCRISGIEVLDFCSFYERLTGRLLVALSHEPSFLASSGFAQSRWVRACKRAIDLVTATVLGVMTMPIMLIVALVIKLDSEGPVLYSQNRVGMDGTVFRVHKFRSMRQDAENSTGAVWATENDPRITAVGRIIRRLRIDELPQLINVLTGEMSMIGPRPERPEMTGKLAESLPLYDYRNLVKPGLTGWAQVCYPYGASIEDAQQKLAYDLYYVKNWSLIFDLQIMLQTSKVVLFGRGSR